jgi:hypothetical protein
VQRLERLPANFVIDGKRMAEILELEAEAAGRGDLVWLLEEVRVAQFAPGPYVRRGATVRHVREALAGVAR